MSVPPTVSLPALTLAALGDWLAASDRGVSPSVSIAVLGVVVLTLALAVALFIFTGN